MEVFLPLYKSKWPGLYTPVLECLQGFAMPDLLDEIKEDIANEKYAMIWQKCGNYIIGAGIAALVATGVGVYVGNYMKDKDASYSDMLFDAQNASQQDALKKYDEIIASANSTYQAIAGLKKAAIMLQTDKTKEALDIYTQIIETSGAPKEFKDLAKLLYVAANKNLAAENKNDTDKNAPKYLQNLENEGIFKFSALEITGFEHFQAKNYTKAKEIFSQIVESRDAPQNIKLRAKEMLDTIMNISAG